MQGHDAKVQYPQSVMPWKQCWCIVTWRHEFLPLLAKPTTRLAWRCVGALRRAASCRILPQLEADWDTEYLDLIVSIRVVDSLEDAIAHINLSRFGAHGYDHHRGARSRGTIPGAGRCSHGHPQRLDAVCRWFSVWQAPRSGSARTRPTRVVQWDSMAGDLQVSSCRTGPRCCRPCWPTGQTLTHRALASLILDRG